MKKSLFFVCPTDFLDSIVNRTFRGEHYIISSLGNSLELNENMLCEIRALVITKKIDEITFILSNNNRFVLDALGEQKYVDIYGMSCFYERIRTQKNHCDRYWQSIKGEELITSYYLHSKMDELTQKLMNSINKPPKIQGKIYCKLSGVFHPVLSDLICLEKFSLN